VLGVVGMCAYACVCLHLVVAEAVQNTARRVAPIRVIKVIVCIRVTGGIRASEEVLCQDATMRVLCMREGVLGRGWGWGWGGEGGGGGSEGLHVCVCVYVCGPKECHGCQ
jgi:hypothetical protein